MADYVGSFPVFLAQLVIAAFIAAAVCFVIWFAIYIYNKYLGGNRK